MVSNLFFMKLKFDTEKCYLKEPRDFLIVIHWFWRFDTS